MRTSNLLFESPTVPKKLTPDSGDDIYFFTSHIHIQIITFSFRSIQCWNINYICLVRKPWFDLICLSSRFCITCILFLSVTCPRANKESVGCRYYRWQPSLQPTEKVSRSIFRRREVHSFYISMLLFTPIIKLCFVHISPWKQGNLHLNFNYHSKDTLPGQECSGCFFNLDISERCKLLLSPHLLFQIKLFPTVN